MRVSRFWFHTLAAGAAVAALTLPLAAQGKPKPLVPSPGNGTLYVSAGAGGIIAVDTETLAQKQLFPLPEYVHGISIDYYGYVWGVSIGANAYRVDIMNNGTFDTFSGLVGAYTYSDMTGVALANVSPQ